MQVSSRRSLGGSALLSKENTMDGDSGAATNTISPFKSKPSAHRNKRYSSAFELKATNSPKTHEEKKKQQAVAEFYQDVVKRVQENKLTAKNAFGSRNIIDNLDVVLQLAKGSFHKASCAVSTAAEVYCLEVDDLCATTSLVQEMLFNSENKRGEMDGEDARANRKKADGSSGSSLNAASSTLETNLSNIRSDQVEAELEVDAQFQKLLQGKDTGAQGMLLNILGVYNGPNLALDCTGIPAFPSFDNDEAENAVVSKMPQQVELSLKTPKALEFKLCKSLVELREELAKRQSSSPQPGQHSNSVVESLDPRASFGTLGTQENRQSLENTSRSSSVTSGSPLGSSTFGSARGMSTGTPDESTPAMEDYEYEDYMDADGGDYDDDDEPALSNHAENGGNTVDTSFEQPNALPMIMRAFEMQAMGADSGKVEYFDAPDLLETIEPAGDHQPAQSGGKYWVGDMHWKAPRMNMKQQEDATVAAALLAEKRKKSSKSKEALIDFFAVPVDERTLFAKPASARTNLMAKSSINKGSFLLPKNMHFSVGDLCRLFVRPTSTFKPLVVISDAKAASSDGEYRYDDAGGAGGYDYENDQPSGFDDDDDDNGFYDCEALPSPIRNLVAPAHHVERIRVAYATRAKKVDVKKLKTDLWETIDTMAASQDPIPIGSLDAVADVEEREFPHSNVSLVGSIQSLAPKEQNETITVPFYFICMLHLANEHGLELQSSPALDDIEIFKTC